MHPTFKFSFERSSHEITYLDLVVYKGQRYNRENILDMRTHTKATDTFQFLHRQSCHPISTFKGLIKGESLRYIRTCNNETDFINKVTTFNAKLRERGYKNQEIQRVTSETKLATRNTLLQHKREIENEQNSLVFTTTYSPHIKTKYIKKALCENWEQIEKDTTLRNLFPRKPIIAYKRNRNIGDKLVNAKVHEITDTREITQQNDPNINILASLLDEQEIDSRYTD